MMRRALSVEPLQGLPSPTLTNPDMILPYNDYFRTSNSSPPPRSTRPPSPPCIIGGPTSHLSSRKSSRPAQGRRSASPRATTPVEMHGSGKTLPDIEGVDTTPRGHKSKDGIATSRGSRSPPLASSPTLARTPIQANVEYLQTPTALVDKRLSNASTSNLSESELGRYGGLDEPGSVDGESFYGDEDEQVNAREDVRQHGLGDHPRSQGNTDAEGGEEMDPHSHAALSLRAERILANAKKRLDNMEGNLNRARHSLVISSTPSKTSSQRNVFYGAKSAMPSLSETSESRIYPALGVPPAKHRQTRSSPSSSGSASHLRVFSESSVPSSIYTSPQSFRQGNGGSASNRRSVTNNGPVPFGDSARPSKALKRKGSRDNDFGSSSGPKTNSSASQSMPTAPNKWSRHPASSEYPEGADVSPKGLAIYNLDPESSFSDAAASDRSQMSNSGLTRSRSTMQMRDLRDHMNDLKGRISSLQQRAHKDKLRRRSLQSLRTPSPFTAAEMWYLSAGANGIGSIGNAAQSGWNGIGRDGVGRELRETIGDVHKEREGTGVKEQEARTINVEERDEDLTEVRSVSDYDGSVGQSQYEDAEEDRLGKADGLVRDDYQELVPDKVNGAVHMPEDSINGEEAYHEASPLPVWERHEDRADAFDYEHFFLHSGQANSDRSTDGRRTSLSSTDSAETTRGPEPTTAINKHWPITTNGSANQDMEGSKSLLPVGHQRNQSVDSVSTMNTFATAREGFGSRDDLGDGESDDERYRLPNPWHGPRSVVNGATHVSWKRSWPDEQSDGLHTPTGQVRSAPVMEVGDVHKNTSSTSSCSDTCSSNCSHSTTRSFPLMDRSKLSKSSSSARPVSVLVSSLKAPSPDSKGSATPGLQLSKDDKILVERLIDSLGKVCVHLHAGSDEAGKYKGRVWRRRLDNARRVLDGENIEY
ncbi:MAG: hypothetical protein M1827_006396 [Pycnora praestabilis]|nr:MAG: hypothetical protein M1827_006396 [Pycnora praestabilis]